MVNIPVLLIQGGYCNAGINTFANILRDHLFWHGTADLRAKLVLGTPNGNAKHQLGKGIGESISEWA